MIIGIGFDAVDIDRFARWHTKSRQQLLRILSAEEIDYCLSTPAKSAERFAARFAAREALYKAIAPHCTKKLPLLTLCAATTVTQTTGAPHLVINVTTLGSYAPELLSYRMHLTLSHSKGCAFAAVIIEKP